MKDFNFDNLFTFDLANNHQGDIKHAQKIIEAMGKISKEEDLKSAFKFQFRDLETLVHPNYIDREDVPHIPRFKITHLSKEDYGKLVKHVKDNQMYTMATPFDEKSVDMLEVLDVELIKIASCSAFDWPLIEKAASLDKPIVISTGGLSLSQIDRLVYFLKTIKKEFALMHCVSIYPTNEEALQLNQIELLKNRFPGVPIGFSTHEYPDNYNPVRIAYAKGARLFERHVGIANEKYKLNAYSSTPEQIKKWVRAYKETVTACGGEERSPAAHEETEALRSLMRGVYVKNAIKKGQALNKDDVYFAMPLQEKQLNSGEWKQGLVTDQAYNNDEPLSDGIADLAATDDEMIAQILLQVKGMLNTAKVVIKENPDVEISHHYGLKRFREFGAVIVDCINRDYCKKLIIQLPRQKHPYHRHEKKEEAFQLLSGDLEIELNGQKNKLKPGDIILINPGDWHKFHTLDGAIIEEVSTTHYNNDSYYEDEKIARLPRERRKTKIDNWSLL